MSLAQNIAPLKEAKLIIEHNATDEDTGFQGFIDSEGWQRIAIVGPGGVVFNFEGRGKLDSLGLTELFFETVEPENTKVPVSHMIALLPEGEYAFEGTVNDGEQGQNQIAGSAWLTHNIPNGPVLRTPLEGARVPADELVMSWDSVTKTINGADVNIIAYQLIVEKDQDPHPHMIGKRGLSMYVSSAITEIALPKGFLQPGTHYNWEVLAIEESGNQTLSSSAFQTY